MPTPNFDSFHERTLESITIGMIYQNEIIQWIDDDPLIAYSSAIIFFNERIQDIEDIILKHEKYVYEYAIHVIDNLNDRFYEGEHIIARNPDHACFYACFGIEDRFPIGEELIVSIPKYKSMYMEYTSYNE